MADYDILTRYTRIINEGEGSVQIRRAMSASFDFDKAEFDILSNYGTHCRERQIERHALKHGRFILSSRRGASSHVHNPFMILTSPETSETAGDVFATVLVYSGNFVAEAAPGQFDSTRAMIGLNPEEFSWKLNPGEDFYTPEAVQTYSSTGLETMSHNFHKLFRTRLARGIYRDARRPVLLNSWEACYFGFDEERLKKIGTCCGDLGIELLVIDDGWFGKRDNDNCSLGDWVVDKRKLHD
jgi:alpha-galactosidase